MKKTKSTNKTLKAIYITAATLFVLVVIAVFLQGNLFAKYSTSAQSSDSARVAAFEVNATSDLTEDQLEIIIDDSSSDDTASFGLTLSNDSEVATECDVTIAITPAEEESLLEDDVQNGFNAKHGFTAKLFEAEKDALGAYTKKNSEDEGISGEVATDGMSVTFPAVYFAAGESSQDFVVEFEYVDPEEFVIGTYSFTATADFNQVD